MTVREAPAASALTDLLFEEPGLGRCLVAPDGTVLRANAEWLRSTGFSLDEVLGAEIADLFPGTRDLTLALHARARAGHRVEVPRHAQRIQGRETWWEGSIGPVPMEGGTGLLITAREVTREPLREEELRRAVERYERQVRLFDGVASTTPDFVYLFDREGRFLYANRRLLEVWGMELSDAVGKTCRELGYEQWHHDMHMREIAQVIETRQPIKGEVPFKAPLTGLFGIYEYIFTPVLGPDGEVEIIAGTTRDVTERKRAEDALRDADRRKSEFLAVLSHELRNPLAPIRNGIRVLQRAPPGSEASARALEVLRRQADHLTRLVDDLLDLTRMTHGKFELQVARIDARDVVRRAWEDARALFDQRDVDLLLAQPGEPLWVDADAARVSQMIGNLLNNALKFTPPGGRVRVGAYRRGPTCEISVSDTGVGIEGPDLERIFDPFVQSERTRRGHGGMGLGLALVRDLAGRMGGKVHAASGGPDQGAEFVILLPLAAPPAAPAAPSHAEGTTAGLSVLIVEDNEDAASTLADLLALGGHRVATASSGREGIDAVAAHAPDVLICDVGLPDMSGHEVIRAVRARLPREALFAVALTGFAQPEDRQAALAAGFDAHLPKPPPLEELDGLLGEAARRKSAG